MFGADVTFQSFTGSLQDLFAKAPKTDSSSTRILLTEQYLIQFGITSEAELDARPLGVVAMYDAEDPSAGSLWEERMTEFADLDIHNTLGISFSEYMNQPRDDILRMNEVVARIKKKKQSEQSSETTKLEQQLRQAGLKG